MKKLTVFYSPLSCAAKFVMGGITLKNVETVPMNIRHNVICKILYRLFVLVGWSDIAVYFRFESRCYKKLKTTEADLLFWDGCPLSMYRHLNRLLKSKRKSVFFWNPLHYRESNDNEITKRIETLKKQGFHLSTFDPIDSKNFGINLYRNVNRRLLSLPKQDIEFDFYFVGASKGREEKILKLKTYLIGKGYSTKFLIINSYHERISPYENIIQSSKCRCIVDFTSTLYKQSGLTLRPFDALFLGKKLITDNQMIKGADFYDPNNILVLDENNYDSIIDFMDKETVAIPSNIVNQYDINTWLKLYYLK